MGAGGGRFTPVQLLILGPPSCTPSNASPPSFLICWLPRGRHPTLGGTLTHSHSHSLTHDLDETVGENVEAFTPHSIVRLMNCAFCSRFGCTSCVRIWCSAEKEIASGTSSQGTKRVK